jgi:hypothetical protein
MANHGRLRATAFAIVLSLGAYAAPAAASSRSGAIAKVPATYAIGDSVLLDAQGALRHLVHKVRVDAVVSRQFDQGLAIVRRLHASHRLTSRFIVFLGTNGPIVPSQFVQMLHLLRTCRRVVLVTLWVPTRGWMRPNNDLIRTGPKRDKNVVLADWTALAKTHPGWFYPDRVHLPIDGPGATALARLLARKLG